MKFLIIGILTLVSTTLGHPGDVHFLKTRPHKRKYMCVCVWNKPSVLVVESIPFGEHLQHATFFSKL